MARRGHQLGQCRASVNTGVEPLSMGTWQLQHRSVCTRTPWVSPLMLNSRGGHRALAKRADLAHAHTHDSHRWNQIATQIGLASNCV